MNCKNCKYSYGGHRDAESDICDNCVCDPDTGWGGFTDHSIGKHFNSDEEAKRYFDAETKFNILVADDIIIGIDMMTMTTIMRMMVLYSF